MLAGTANTYQPFTTGADTVLPPPVTSTSLEPTERPAVIMYCTPEDETHSSPSRSSGAPLTSLGKDGRQLTGDLKSGFPGALTAPPALIVIAKHSPLPEPAVVVDNAISVPSGPPLITCVRGVAELLGFAVVVGGEEVPVEPAPPPEAWFLTLATSW